MAKIVIDGNNIQMTPKGIKAFVENLEKMKEDLMKEGYPSDTVLVKNINFNLTKM